MSNLPILRIMLRDFSNIKPPLNSPYKSYIIMVNYLSNICGIGFACILLRIFDPAFLGKICVRFNFLSCLCRVCGLGPFSLPQGQEMLWWRSPGCTSSGPEGHVLWMPCRKCQGPPGK